MVRVQTFVSAGVILISMSVPAIAQTPQPGWVADTHTGCKVWDPKPLPNETITWSGACVSGLAQGRGVLQWFSDGKPTERDEGELRDGQRNGHNVQTDANGYRSEGEYLNGKVDGHLVSTLDNLHFEGEVHGASARGVLAWSNGDRYEGEFRDGKPNGLGQYTTSNGVLRGVWTDGCFRDGDRRAAISRDPSSCP